jgi:hypothetical protein
LLTGLILFIGIIPRLGLSCELPVKGQTFDASSVESGTFTVNLSSAYSPDQVIQVENNVKACQSLISSRLLGFQDKVSSLISDKASIEGFHNIKDQISRIKTLEAEKVSIKEALTKDLSQITLKGLYAVIIEANVRAPRDELLEAAKRIIAPQATNDLRGVAINSVTVVEGSKLVFDRIIAETSGEMDVETMTLEERKFFKGKTQLLYVAVVKVYPLSGGGIKKITPQGPEQSSIADLLSGKGISGFQQELANFTTDAYATEKMISLKQMVSIWQDVIQQGNRQATKKEGELLAQLARRLSEKDDEIQEAQQKVKDGRKRLRENYSRVGFNCSKEAEECLSEAVSYMDGNTKRVVDESFKEKEKELVVAKELVRGAGDPEKEIHRLARDLFQNLKTNYGKREQFLSLTVVDKMVLARAEDKQGYYIVRSPREISLYPYYDDRGDMHLLLVMSFKVEREGLPETTLSKPVTQPIYKPKRALIVNSVPSGAGVYLNGSYKVNTPSIIDFPEGVNKVEFKKEGYKTWTANFAFKEGMEFKLNPFLEKISITVTNWIEGKQGIERVENGEIDWTQRIIHAKGSGFPPERARSIPEARLIAEQRALADAKSKLLEVIKRIRVNPATVVGDYIVRNDQIRFKIEDLVHSSATKVGHTRYFSDGTVEVTVAFNMSEEFLALMDRFGKNSQ